MFFGALKTMVTEIEQMMCELKDDEQQKTEKTLEDIYNHASG